MRSTIDRLRRLLEAGHELTYAGVQARLGIASDRHARRLITQLREEGLAVQERRDGHTKHFFLAPEDRREAGVPFALTPQEALALSVAAGAARAMLHGTPLETPLASGFERLVERLTPRFDWVDLDEQRDRWYFGAIALNRIDPEIFRTLLEGLEGSRSVLIDYAKPGDPSTGRKLDPLCFAVLGNAVLLTAYCHRAEDLRDFALSRITRAVLCDPAADLHPYFDRPEDFDPKHYYVDDRFGALTGDEPRVYRLRVEPEVAHLFHERDYHPSQDIDDEEEEGRLVVSYEFASMQDFRSFAQSFGTRVTVLEPPELVEQMRREAEELARRYAARTEATS